ncbi:O-methyltransferase [Paenibacillus silvae]|uniref:O-methyltransferase n=1 Tax=Paenibacillus silvae TaxID=1325358 RepID=UPI0016431CED|nr:MULTISPECIES: O-methyltransferase [Paenibacillus]MCK6076320.1 O-methyltransferase [Paenibacillus silvae]MCK6078325.1 O-methyltransferase [Paenibacillus silvae]MCK6150521.1 O-methyltransferase [Paenibacillus silvae]MCK6268781.1 O-methyltransferase [Paenibacillus silvae]MCK6270374.1 O-methyltransferase [Paenibacillus silvae]
MKMEQLSLARQLDLVFKELDQELAGLDSGVVFVQIRNNIIGKFGVRHNPIAGRDGQMELEGAGLTHAQRASFRVMALETLKFKRNWTHGEISYDFTVRQNMILVDATMESNYNMANLMIRYPRTNTYPDSNRESS